MVLNPLSLYMPYIAFCLMENKNYSGESSNCLSKLGSSNFPSTYIIESPWSFRWNSNLRGGPPWWMPLKLWTRGVFCCFFLFNFFFPFSTQLLWKPLIWKEGENCDLLVVMGFNIEYTYWKSVKDQLVVQLLLWGTWTWDVTLKCNEEHE